MKIKLLLVLLMVSFLSFSQTTKLTLPNLENEFEVKLEKNIDDGVDVLITDSKNPGVAWRLSEKKDVTVAAFTQNVFKTIGANTGHYYFKSPTVKVAFKISKTDLAQLTHPIFATAVSQLKKEDFLLLLKVKTKFNNATGVTFDELLKKVSAIGNTTPVFSSNANFVLKRTAADKIGLFDGTTAVPTVDVTKENLFYDTFFTTYAANVGIIQSTVLTTDDFNAIVKTFAYDSDENSKKLDETYMKAVGKSDYSLINNYYVTDSITSKIKVVSVSVKNNFKENFFNLKFCNKDYKCKEPVSMPYDIDKSQFKSEIKSFLRNDFDEGKNKIGEVDLESLYNSIKKNSEKKAIEENSKEFKKEIASLAEQIDNIENQYSGILKLNKEIRVYKDSITVDRKLRRDKKKRIVDPNNKFIADYATIRFFNNKAKEIVIVGKLKKKKKNTEDLEFVTVNFQHSVPIRSLNNSLQYVPISPNDSDADSLYINYNDLLQYYPYESSFNYSVRNKEYKLKANDTIKVEQKKLMDYFTAVIFSDVLGINNENANGLVQAEGRIKIPLWIFNRKKSSVFHSLSADVNATLYNGFDDSSRHMKPVNNNKVTDTLIVNNFDYIKFNNINMGVNLNIYNFEMKGLSTEFSVAYGMRYYRAGLRYTLERDSTDVVKNYQLHALSHEVSVNFEIRPQINFGADLNAGFNWINARGSTGDLPIVFNKDDNNDDRSVLRIHLNLYTKINPDKTNDGIYARLGGFYHLGAKDFYPQILIGYATNLSSFVNKFNKK